jgi:ammonia channel protein AmtB
MGFGFGYVDFGGGSLIMWVPSIMMLGFLLVQPKHNQMFERPKTPPVSHAPLVSNIGALIMGIGWMGWVLSNPFHIADTNVHWGRTSLSLVLGMAGAAASSQLYGWLVAGAPEMLLAARGFSAGWAVLLVGAPFFPPWLALVLGLLSGIVFPFIHFFIESRSMLRNAAGILALGLTAGPIGVLSVALFADGRWGQNWNRMATIGDTVLSEAINQQTGVGGVFTSGNIDQLKAQVIGLGALGLWGLFWGLGFGLVVRLFSGTEPQEKDADITENSEDTTFEGVGGFVSEELATPAEIDLEEGLVNDLDIKVKDELVNEGNESDNIQDED